MRVYVNGETKDIPRDSTLLELLTELDLKPERIAAEWNGQVVPRQSWASSRLGEGDRIEIVHFVGGGSRSVR